MGQWRGQCEYSRPPEFSPAAARTTTNGSSLFTFALSVFASLCYWVIIVLPCFDDEFEAAKQAALESALGPVPQIVLASLLAFLAG